MQPIKGRRILFTGGTGSFGRAYVKHVLNNGVERVVVFSRDEDKHKKMAVEVPDERVRYLVGDVRDLPRLRRAMGDIDTVVHAAALKDVPIGEYNPGEVIKTNIGGTENVIEAALDCGVEKIVLLSTDKSVDPINL